MWLNPNTEPFVCPQKVSAMGYVRSGITPSPDVFYELRDDGTVTPAARTVQLEF
jgi:hypothetical protein